MPKKFSAYKGTARCCLATTKIRAGESLREVLKILRYGFHSRVCSRCNITTVSGQKKALGADWSGLERTSAPPRQAETLYLPRLRKRSPRCRGGTPLSCGPRSAKTANSRSIARFPLPALPARAELRDAEVHAMLGELDFGESAVMGDATAEERQAIANFDIRAFA